MIDLHSQKPTHAENYYRPAAAAAGGVAASASISSALACATASPAGPASAQIVATMSGGSGECQVITATATLLSAGPGVEVAPPAAAADDDDAPDDDDDAADVVAADDDAVADVVIVAAPAVGLGCTTASDATCSAGWVSVSP